MEMGSISHFYYTAFLFIFPHFFEKNFNFYKIPFISCQNPCQHIVIFLTRQRETIVYRATAAKKEKAKQTQDKELPSKFFQKNMIWSSKKSVLSDQKPVKTHISRQSPVKFPRKTPAPIWKTSAKQAPSFPKKFPENHSKQSEEMSANQRVKQKTNEK